MSVSPDRSRQPTSRKRSSNCFAYNPTSPVSFTEWIRYVNRTTLSDISAPSTTNSSESTNKPSCNAIVPPQKSLPGKTVQSFNLRTRPRTRRRIGRMHQASQRLQQLLRLLRILPNQLRIPRIDLDQVSQVAQRIGNVD